MADVALRGIPDSLHREFKTAAKRNHRSLNGEILARLAALLRPAPVDAVGLLERIGRWAPSTWTRPHCGVIALKRPGRRGGANGGAASDGLVRQGSLILDQARAM